MSPVHYESFEAPLRTLLSSERSSGSSLNRVLPASRARIDFEARCASKAVQQRHFGETSPQTHSCGLPRINSSSIGRSHSTAHQAIRSNAQHVQASERIPATPPLRTSPLSPRQIWARTAARRSSYDPTTTKKRSPPATTTTSRRRTTTAPRSAAASASSRANYYHETPGAPASSSRLARCRNALLQKNGPRRRTRPRPSRNSSTKLLT